MCVCWTVDPGHGDGGSVTTEYVHALTGATVELRCAVTASRRADILWRRDGVDLTAAPGSRFQLKSYDALDIVDVQLDDAGQYTCHVVDAYGDVQWKRFVVQVIGMINLPTSTTVILLNHSQQSSDMLIF